MNIGTAANAVFHMRQVEEKELKQGKNCIMVYYSARYTSAGKREA